jgi:hypothetical protein
MDLSGSLFYIFGTFQVRLLGENVFDNIWLIDRTRDFAANSDEVVAKPNHGLIMNIEKMSGMLYIGGQSDEIIQPSNTPLKITKF